ncbi:MAG: carbonic anhydrase [Dehalococcoidia bacterium]
MSDLPHVPAAEAYERLRSGNQRFSSNVRSVDALLSQLNRADLSEQQAPFAVIVGCSDSRAPAEIVFDQGLGDLFVVRVAGNVVAPTQVESVEFAASRFRTRLVVVMGHTRCGAIEATIEDAFAGPDAGTANHLGSIVGRIRPSVDALIAAGMGNDRAALAREAIRTNVHVSAEHLRHGSPLLESLIADDGLMIVGAEYDLETGVVDFFDTPGRPADAHHR